MKAFLLLAAQVAAQPAQVVIRPGGMVQIVGGGLLQVGDDSGSGGSDPSPSPPSPSPPPSPLPPPPMPPPASPPYAISYCGDFNSASGGRPYLMRTQTSGTQTKWTIATWFKSSPDRLGLSERHLFGAQRSSSSCCNDETHLGVAYSTTRQMTTTFHDTSDQQQQYRAASVSLSDDTYHHVAWTFDSTASPTVSRVWLDGNEVTSFGSSASIPHNSVGSVGRSGRPFAWADNGVGQTSTFPFDGRLCDSIYLDGVAIDDPVSGGLLTPSGGPADPQELAYGPNGSWQDYADSSNLGRDASPNGNDFETHGGGYVGQRAF